MKSLKQLTKRRLSWRYALPCLVAFFSIVSLPLFADNPLQIKTENVEELKKVTRSVTDILFGVFMPAAGIVSAVWAIISSFFKQSLQPLVIYGAIALVCFFVPFILKLVFHWTV